MRNCKHNLKLENQVEVATPVPAAEQVLAPHFDRKSYIKIYLKRYREIYKEKIKSSSKTYYEAHKRDRQKYRIINKDKMKQYCQIYYKTHKSEMDIFQREYRKTHKEEIKKYTEIYLQSPRGKFFSKLYSVNRRLREKGLTIIIIQQVYEENIKKFGTLTCYLCIEPIEFGKDHLEHKTPLSRGGTNAKNNLAVSCDKCNYKKHSKTEAEYREELCKNEI